MQYTVARWGRVEWGHPAPVGPDGGFMTIDRTTTAGQYRAVDDSAVRDAAVRG